MMKQHIGERPSCLARTAFNLEGPRNILKSHKCKLPGSDKTTLFQYRMLDKIIRYQQDAMAKGEAKNQQAELIRKLTPDNHNQVQMLTGFETMDTGLGINSEGHFVVVYISGKSYKQARLDVGSFQVIYTRSEKRPYFSINRGSETLTTLLKAAVAHKESAATEKGHYKCLTVANTHIF